MSNNVSSKLMQRIADRSAVICVMGLGYVGLPLIRAFHLAGFHTLGFDVDRRKIDRLAAGQNYLKHLGDDFPAADMRVFDFTKGKKFSVFEGQRTVKARFTAPSSTGSIVLDGVFKYQACDQHACYPPNKVAVHVTVKVER